MTYRPTNSNQFLDKAKSLVVQLFANQPDLFGDEQSVRFISPDDFYVVWFAKTLQNWKALVSTDIVSGLYIEVTYNGSKQESYLDVYRKDRNVCIPDRVRAAAEIDVSGHPAVMM